LDNDFGWDDIRDVYKMVQERRNTEETNIPVTIQPLSARSPQPSKGYTLITSCDRKLSPRSTGSEEDLLRYFSEINGGTASRNPVWWSYYSSGLYAFSNHSGFGIHQARNVPVYSLQASTKESGRLRNCVLALRCFESKTP
jgi:hypothetical protein